MERKSKIILLGMIMLLIACVMIENAQAGKISSYRVSSDKLTFNHDFNNDVLKISCFQESCYFLTFDETNYAVGYLSKENILSASTGTSSTTTMVIEKGPAETENTRGEDWKNILDFAGSNHLGGHSLFWETPLRTYDSILGIQPKKTHVDGENVNRFVSKRYFGNSAIMIDTNYTLQYNGNSLGVGYKVELLNENQAIYITRNLEFGVINIQTTAKDEYSNFQKIENIFRGNDAVYILGQSGVKQYLYRLGYDLDVGNAKKIDVTELTKTYTIGDVKKVPGKDQDCLYLRNGVMYCTSVGGTTFSLWKNAEGKRVGGFEWIENDFILLHELDDYDFDKCNFIKSDRSCNAMFENNVYCRLGACNCRSNFVDFFDERTEMMKVRTPKNEILFMDFAGETCETRITEANYADDLSKFTLRFKRNGLNSGLVDCNSIFNTDKFGVGPICSYNEEEHKLEVEFGTGATQIPLEGIQLGKEYFLKTSGGITEAVKNAFKSGVAVKAPAEVGKCDELIIDLSESVSFPHRASHYTYRAVNGSDANSNPISIVSEDALLSSTSNKLLIISPDHFKTEGTYHVNVSSTAFRFQSESIVSNIKTFQFRRTNALNPRFDILGGVVQTATLGKTIKLIAEPLITECSKDLTNDFRYNWKIPNDVALYTSTNGKFIEVLFSTIGVFTFELDVTYGNNVLTKSVQVSTSYPTIEMTFPSGSHRTAPSSRNLNLEVKVHNVLDINNQKNFNWICKNGAGATIYQQQADGLNSISIPSALLSSGLKVNCDVTYSYNNDLTKTETVSATIVEGIVPQVQIIREGNSDFIPAGSPFILNSNVTGISKSTGRILYKWTVVRNGEPLTLQQGVNTITPDNLPTFAIASDMLIPGTELQITLRVTGERSSIVGSGENQIIAKINTPPVDGTCTTFPLVGNILDTEFALSCSGWIDEHHPLEYSFAVAPANSDNYEIIQRFSRKTNFISQFGQSGSLKLRYSVRDSLGSVTTVYSTVTVNNQGDQTALLQRINTIIDVSLKAALDVGDSEESRRILSQVSSTLKNISPSVVGYEITKSKLVDALFRAKTVLIEAESESSVQQQSNIVKNLVEGTDANDGTTQKSVMLYLTSLLNTPENLNVDASVDIGKSLSTVLGATSLRANSDDVRSEVTNTILESVTKLVDNLALKQLNGAKPTIVNTDNLQFGIYTSFGNDMSKNSISLSNGASLSIPDNTVDTDEPVDISFTVLKNDPHFSIRSKDSARNLTSSVTRLLFKIDGKEQAVHDKREPMVITIPANNDLEAIENDPTKPGVRPQCKFLNVLNNEWETTGCNVTSFTATSTTCECNHATDFGSFMDYVMPDLNILKFEDLKLLEELNADNMTTLVVLSTLSVGYFMLLALFNGFSLAWCLGRRLSKHRVEKKKYIFSENEMRGYVRPLIEKMKKSHIWFSVFFKPETQSSFNRSRRLTIIMVIIFGSMLSNALTFGTKQQNWVQSILAGIFADIVTMPFIFGFTFLFTKVKPRDYVAPMKTPKHKKNKISVVMSPEEEMAYVNEQEMKQSSSEADDKSLDDLSSTESNGEDVIVASATKNTRMDIVYDTIDEKLKWGYDQYVYMTERVTWYGLTVLFLSTFFYFATVAACMVIIYHTIHWFSPELELFIFGTCAVFLYFAALEVIYLSTKARRFQSTNMSWRGKTGWKIQLLICLFLIVFLFCGIFVSVFFMDALDRNGLPNEWMITIKVGLSACIGLVLIWMFDILRNPKKKEVASKKGTNFFARPWFPWYFAYPIYIGCWLWMAGSGVALVIYGIKFNKWGQGTDIKWLVSSFVSNAQNIFISKPISFIAKTVVLMAVIRLLESLFFRIRRERPVETA